MGRTICLSTFSFHNMLNNFHRAFFSHRPLLPGFSGHSSPEMGVQFPTEKIAQNLLDKPAKAVIIRIYDKRSDGDYVLFPFLSESRRLVRGGRKHRTSGP